MQRKKGPEAILRALKALDDTLRVQCEAAAQRFASLVAENIRLAARVEESRAEIAQLKREVRRLKALEAARESKSR